MIETKEALLKFIAGNIGVNIDIKETDSLKDDLDMDELDRIELTMALEEEFGFSMPDEIIDECKIVQDIINYLESKNIILK